MTNLPDPERLGGIAWLERTGGVLTRAESWQLARATIATYGRFFAGGPRMLRRPAALPVDPPTAPDSALARHAAEACLDAGSHLAGHGFRTWCFGSIFARLDGVDIDDELFWVAALLHDHGLLSEVAGEDFTLRSGRVAADCLTAHDRTGDTPEVTDAISVHCQPGVSPKIDGALGAYVQVGALADIVGFRTWDLPKLTVDRILAEHDRSGFPAEIRRLIAREAAPVPGGRFALNRRLGFTAATRMSLIR